VSVALVMQYEKRMRHILLSSVACLALQYIFTVYHKRHNFGKKAIEHKICVLIFSTNFVWNISHSKKNSATYYHKCAEIFTQSTRSSSQFLNKFQILRQIFEKYWNTKAHKNPPNGSRVIACGRTNGKTDRHNEANSRFWTSLKNV